MSKVSIPKGFPHAESEMNISMESVRLIKIIFSAGNYFIYHKLLTLSPLCLYIYKLQTNLQNAIVIVAQGVPLESSNTKFEGTTACCFPTSLYIFFFSN